MKFHPTRLQWCIIWLTSIVAAHFWLGLQFSALLPAQNAAWGLFPYLNSYQCPDEYDAYTRCRSGEGAKFAVTVLAFGALILWEETDRRRP